MANATDFLSVLSRRQRTHLLLIQLLFAVNSLFELISIAGVAPFMAVLANRTLIEQNKTIHYLYVALGFQSTETFIAFLGALVLLVIIIANTVALLTLRFSTYFIYRLSAELANDLFRFYVGKKYLFHVYSNSARLSSNIQAEVRRLADTVLVPALTLNSRIVTIVFIATGLLVLDPFLTLIVFFVLFSGYLGILRFIRKGLTDSGVAATETYVGRGKALQEAFGGIKEIKAFRKESDFQKNFDHWNQAYNMNVARGAVLATAPKNIMEMVAFGGLIAIVLYLFKKSQSFEALMPILSVYAMAGFKLMPALQQSFQALAYINGNINAYEVLAPDLKAARVGSISEIAADLRCCQVMRGIELRNIRFKFPTADRQILDDVSLEIPANKTVAFVGASGSGKTTCADIVLGLLDPDSGELLVDGQLMEKGGEGLRGAIGYVSQTIYLIDDTIAANIAFSPMDQQIDQERLKRCVRQANLEEFIESLPQKYESRVGERGVQLSGGQRQRIGIARALYHGASVLIFDEATSALDGISEKSIMESIAAMSGSHTIVLIAHRLSTVRNADKIFLFENGRVIAEGAFDDLLKTNPKFRRMVETTSA